MPFERGGNTGGAWLSSARVVRCLVESCNERNPHRQLSRPFSFGGGRGGKKLERLPLKAGGRWGRRQVSMPLKLWATHVLQWPRQRDANLKGANLYTWPKLGLQAATRPHEGGIASNRGSEYSGEYVPGPCTHRPSHHGSWSHPKSSSANLSSYNARACFPVKRGRASSLFSGS